MKYRPISNGGQLISRVLNRDFLSRSRAICRAARETSFARLSASDDRDFLTCHPAGALYVAPNYLSTQSAATVEMADSKLGSNKERIFRRRDNAANARIRMRNRMNNGVDRRFDRLSRCLRPMKRSRWNEFAANELRIYILQEDKPDDELHYRMQNPVNNAVLSLDRNNLNWQEV